MDSGKVRREAYSFCKAFIELLLYVRPQAGARLWLTTLDVCLPGPHL